jgi:hypothetical protein
MIHPKQQIITYLAKRSTIPAASTFRNKHICCSLGGKRRLSRIDVVSGNIDLTTKEIIFDAIDFLSSCFGKKNMFTQLRYFLPIGYTYA